MRAMLNRYDTVADDTFRERHATLIVVSALVVLVAFVLSTRVDGVRELLTGALDIALAQ
jgi:hypothetical protein